MAKVEVELADGTKAGSSLKELTKEAAKLRKEVAGLPEGTKEFVAAAKKLNEVEGSIADLKEEIKSTVSASETLKKAWDNLPGAEYINNIADSVGMFNKGVGGLSSQFGGLKVAIAATGLGLLLILLGSLVTWLRSTQAGMDKVTSVTRPLQAIFQSLIGVVQTLGGKVFKQLGEAIKNPIGALKDLGQILLDNVINRFKAFALMGPAIMKIMKGDFEEGFKDLGNATLQVATGVTNVIDRITDAGKAVGTFMDEAWKKGALIDELQKQIEKAEIAQIKRSKELELGLKLQKDIVEDQTKSWDQRRAAAQKALHLEQEALNNELSLLDKRIEKMKVEQSLNDTSREQQKELAELEAQKLELQAKTTEQSIEWKNKIREFDKAQADEQAAALQKRLDDEKKAWEEYYNNLRNLEDLKVQAMADSREKDLAQLKLNLQSQIEALDKNAPFYAERVKAMTELAGKERAAINEKWTKIDLEKERARIDEKLKLIEDATRDEQLILLERFAFQEMTEQEYGDALYDIQVQNLERQLQLLETEGQQKSEKYKAIYADLLQLNHDHNEEIEERDRERVNATISGAGELAAALIESYQTDIDAQQARVDRLKDLHGEESAEYKQAQEDLTKIKRENGNKQKRAERTQVALNLITEMSSIWQGAATLGPIAGPIVGGILTAAALLRANSAMKKIDSTQFAKGGFIKGPSHAQGGVPFTIDGQPGFEAEGGEVIINKRSASRFRNQLSAINSFSGWGRRFETGGPVSPFRDRSRGPVPSAAAASMASSGSSGSTDSLLRELIQETRATREDLAAYKRSNDERIDRLQVNNNLQETQKGLNTLNRIQSEANV